MKHEPITRCGGQIIKTRRFRAHSLARWAIAAFIGGSIAAAFIK